MLITRNVMAMLATGLCLCGCAGADYQPVVDMRGHTVAQYDHDLSVCQQTARSIRDNGKEAENAGIGAGVGAAGGAVLGAIGGDALLGAGVGALAGLVGTGGFEEVKTETREETIVKNCMRDRGYTILG